MGPEQALCGNLDPVREVRDGSPETIVLALESLLGRAGARWIVAAGCEIVRDTRHENVRALTGFAKAHTVRTGMPI
jgi:uroporphyrinogen-III decarboxylase